MASCPLPPPFCRRRWLPAAAYLPAASPRRCSPCLQAMARRGKKRAAPPPSEEEDKLQQGDVKLEPGIKAEPGTTDVKSVPGTTYVKPEPGIKPEPADEEQQRAGAYPLAAAAPADGSTEMERERAAM